MTIRYQSLRGGRDEKAICIFNYDYNAWLYYIRADLFYRNKGEAVFFPRKG